MQMCLYQVQRPQHHLRAKRAPTAGRFRIINARDFLIIWERLWCSISMRLGASPAVTRPPIWSKCRANMSRRDFRSLVSTSVERTIAKKFKIQYPLGFPDDELVDNYLKDNQNIPQTFVFDRSGSLVKRFIGYDRQGGRELERIVQQTLNSTMQ